MRGAGLPLLSLLIALPACSTSQPAGATADDASPLPSEDGSTTSCTAVGGTCVSYEQPDGQGCPVAQQNTALCENSVLICCLPAGGERVPTDEGGGDDAGPEPGDATPGMDAPAPMESGPPQDSSMGQDTSMPMEASSPTDASMPSDSSSSG